MASKLTRAQRLESMRILKRGMTARQAKKMRKVAAKELKV